jgi:hypothetical protein
MWSALRRHWTFSYLDDVAEVGTDEASILNYADQHLNDAFGDYRRIYENWASAYGSDRILLLRFDRLKSSPNETIARVLEFIGLNPDLDWIRAYRESASVPNQSKVDVEMPDFVRYYLSRRYVERTRAFNKLTGGFVQDWVEDLEKCVADVPAHWKMRYVFRSAAWNYPTRFAHQLLDPLRMRWKVRRARQKLSVSC